jgi:hypothetical protein
VDENPTLSEAVFNAISDWLGDSGMATGFLLIVPTINSKGGSDIRVAYPDEQPFHVSLGLAVIADESLRTEFALEQIERGADD